MERTDNHQKALEHVKERQDALTESCLEIFTKHKNCVFELGCGHGHFLTAYAEAHPEQFCLGIDLITKRIDKGTSKQGKRQLENLLFLKAEGVEFLTALPAHVKFERIFIMFPDPWPKKRHHKRRIIQEEFLSLIAKRCNAGTELCFRTDHNPYFDWTVEKIEAHPDWTIKNNTSWPFENESFFQNILPDYQSLVAIRT